MYCSEIFDFSHFFLRRYLYNPIKPYVIQTSTPLIANPVKAIIFAETFHRGGYVLSLFFKLPPSL